MPVPSCRLERDLRFDPGMDGARRRPALIDLLVSTAALWLAALAIAQPPAGESLPAQAPVTEPLPAVAQPAGPPGRDRIYCLVPRLGDKGLRRLFAAEQLALLEKLNRRDVAHLGRAAALVVPEEWLPDELAYSPLPLDWPWAAAEAKALVVDQPAQVFGAYEQGRLVRWGPVSSGRKTAQTPAGLFHLNWKSTGRHSTVDASWYMPWYFNFHTRRGLAFHQLDLPGRPASHACVRLLQRDAKWLYGWGEGTTLDERRRAVAPGTPVLIVGKHDFGAPPPWLSLEWLARGVELPDAWPPAGTQP